MQPTRAFKFASTPVVLSSAVLAAAAFSSSAALANLDCQRFDALVNELEPAAFAGCQIRYHEGTAKVQAVYMVEAANAANMATKLGSRFDMPALVKDCCQWRSFNPSTGSTSGAFVAADRLYKVSMQSTHLKLGWDPSSDVEHSGLFEVLISDSGAAP